MVYKYVCGCIHVVKFEIIVYNIYNIAIFLELKHFEIIVDSHIKPIYRQEMSVDIQCLSFFRWNPLENCTLNPPTGH